jgi:3,4-dihydroxy 2-butanone 4-phosphate synthase/GTP cyclohydrolase II
MDVERAIEDLRSGRMLVLRGGPGDTGELVVAAEHADAATINVMARDARGLIRLALPPEQARRLGLRRQRTTEPLRPGADLLVSIEAREGTTTGISAADRARTVAAAVHPDAAPADLVSPGHVFPLLTAEGGVRSFAAPAEAAVDLLRLAGLRPAAVGGAILDDDGELATGAALDAIAARLGVGVLPVAAVVAHRTGARSAPVVALAA